MDIIRIWYIIEHRADPSTIKNAIFFTSTWGGGLAPPVAPLLTIEYNFRCTKINTLRKIYSYVDLKLDKLLKN